MEASLQPTSYRHRLLLRPHAVGDTRLGIRAHMSRIALHTQGLVHSSSYVKIRFFRDKLKKNSILMDEYIPLGDTRYVFRISEYIILMKK